VLRQVAAEAPLWLAPGGHLLTEASERQAPKAAEVITRSGLIARVARSGELDALVVIGAQLTLA
jgi:release factor glutamine methyltransferase